MEYSSELDCFVFLYFVAEEIVRFLIAFSPLSPANDQPVIIIRSMNIERILVFIYASFSHL
tara:strand:+ start:416 stop:598 length:183 start_codon:yes stop_codon:yes gene_type:complete